MKVYGGLDGNVFGRTINTFIALFHLRPRNVISFVVSELDVLDTRDSTVFDEDSHSRS